MPEPRVICISRNVPTAALERAVRKLPSAKYPRRLEVLHKAIIERRAEEREMRKAA